MDTFHHNLLLSFYYIFPSGWKFFQFFWLILIFILFSLLSSNAFLLHSHILATILSWQSLHSMRPKRGSPWNNGIGLAHFSQIVHASPIFPRHWYSPFFITITSSFCKMCNPGCFWQTLGSFRIQYLLSPIGVRIILGGYRQSHLNFITFFVMV